MAGCFVGCLCLCQKNGSAHNAGALRRDSGGLLEARLMGCGWALMRHQSKSSFVSLSLTGVQMRHRSKRRFLQYVAESFSWAKWPRTFL